MIQSQNIHSTSSIIWFALSALLLGLSLFDLALAKPQTRIPHPVSLIEAVKHQRVLVATSADNLGLKYLSQISFHDGEHERHIFHIKPADSFNGSNNDSDMPSYEEVQICSAHYEDRCLGLKESGEEVVGLVHETEGLRFSARVVEHHDFGEETLNYRTSEGSWLCVSKKGHTLVIQGNGPEKHECQFYVNEF